MKRLLWLVPLLGSDDRRSGPERPGVTTGMKSWRGWPRAS